MTLTQIGKSLFYFIMAGLCEIGGGYLIWLWLREGKNFLFALAGSVILIIYGIIPTLQSAHFSRGLCSLRRCFHSPFHPLGLADR